MERLRDYALDQQQCAVVCYRTSDDLQNPYRIAVVPVMNHGTQNGYVPNRACRRRSAASMLEAEQQVACHLI